MQFHKMNGAGNDFVMLDNRDRQIQLTREQIELLCDRHRGIGADGLLLLEQGQDDCDFTMRYFNSDGGEAEMCGNGARCFARYASLIAGPFEMVSFSTLAGKVSATINSDNTVTITMSTPHSLDLGRQLTVDQTEFTVHSINTGVPHAVVECADLHDFDVAAFGRLIRNHEQFTPAGTNVNFFQYSADRNATVRTFERGVEQETLACGTGVVATAIIINETYKGGSPVRVKVKGGETLEVNFTKADDTYQDVTLSGPADFVFSGEIEL